MTLPLIIGLSALGAILIAIIIFQYLHRTSDKKESAVRDYAEALNYLIAGNSKEALDRLRRSVRIDTDNVDAYIKIGDLFRKMGMVDKAIKVHLDLTIREGLNAGPQIQIYRSLVLDYHASGEYDQALKYVERILSYSKDEEWGLDWKLRLSELRGDWDVAFTVQKRIQKKKGAKDPSILALYRVEHGIQLQNSGKNRDGRIRFREAIKIDSKCVPAYLKLCDSYINENRNADALHELRRLITAVPKWSHLAFDRIKEILFDVGSFSDIENVYQAIIKNNPNHVEANLGLASLYEKKGEIYKAIEFCRKAQSKDKDSIKVQRTLARLYQSVNKYEEAAKFAIGALEQLSEIQTNFKCSKCGYQKNTPFWHCEQCGTWNSVLD
jgi:lipopolysaccharide biosynthesis regulator YciM